MKMCKKGFSLVFLLGLLSCLSVSLIKAEDPYKFFTWTVTYGTIAPLGIPQQGILINGQFPGPALNCVTNDNIIVNVINMLKEPFLLTWNGIKQRKNPWQDGVLGTNCPIPSNASFTYKMQAKDQIGTFTYFPSTAMHRAAGGYGAFNVNNRIVIPLPYPVPDAEHTLLIGDWYTTNHKVLQSSLDSGKLLRFPDGILINGLPQGSRFIVNPGKTYRIRISNVGLMTSFNFRIQGHTMKLVEVEGSHTIQYIYESLDVHVGQSLAVLVTANQPPKDYYIVASTRFTRQVLAATALLRYSNSRTPVSGPLPLPPPHGIAGSLLQARTFRWNLTANAARPNPQGSFHYGQIVVAKTIVLANSAPIMYGKQRYAVNRVSYVNPDTPLKLADYFNIPGVFNLSTIQSMPSPGSAYFGASVLPANFHDFVEIVFQNNENSIQSWHIDGYDFWVVGFGFGQWTTNSRKTYNLLDAVTRYTTQVYPNSWTAILVSLDNKGMWNIRSAMWARQYLGQQLYLRVDNEERSPFTEYNIPPNALLCGKAKGRRL